MIWRAGVAVLLAIAVVVTFTYLGWVLVLPE